ncbi:golgin subfamily B member 1 [Prunus yedoensis var. nudiflora]|uniref:Golgin subfamily B member 1 n=1 Tax=Prunus yedoensis var. nudiflora TaxID=2094558 RepID=A0A314V5B1_PRUYE|nr:golgin subfamily B member 1 [Prunus yedoensis var. nudiflora]
MVQRDPKVQRFNVLQLAFSAEDSNMKKLFFFRSSASSNGNNNVSPSTDKQIYWENPSEDGNQVGDMAENSFRSPKGFFSKSRKQVTDIQNSSKSQVLEGAGHYHQQPFLEMSQHKTIFLLQDIKVDLHAVLHVAFLINNVANHLAQVQYLQSCLIKKILLEANFVGLVMHTSCRTLTPERHEAKPFEVPAVQNTHGLERPCSAGSSRIHHDSSGSSSTCSSNISSKVLDRYIDGEQEERGRQKNSSSSRNLCGNGNGGGCRPPRAQFTAPNSPRAHSFREAKSSRFRLSSRDWAENGFGHESPRRLAKNVVERLSQSHVIQPTHEKEFDHDMPVTIEDIYGRSDLVSQKNYHGDDYSSLQKLIYGENCDGLNTDETQEDMDVELERRLKEAEENVMLLSEELEQESFLRDSGYNVQQTVRNLTDQRINLALEVSNLLQLRIAERGFCQERTQTGKGRTGVTNQKTREGEE